MSLAVLLMILGPGAPFAVAPVSDAELAQHRGGFRLPSGIEVALTVQTQTAVDGAVVLSTVFRAAQGAPSFAAFVPKAGTSVSATTSGGRAGGSATMPTVTYDRQNGLQVIPGAAAPSVTMGDDIAPLAAGLEQVTGAESGVVTDNGRVTVDTGGAVQRVTLQGSDLAITHFAGRAFGSAIANSGNDRAIDTRTIVAIDLANAGPDVLGSAVFRVEGLALDGLRNRF
jgi:hypothetical protein